MEVSRKITYKDVVPFRARLISTIFGLLKRSSKPRGPGRRVCCFPLPTVAAFKGHWCAAGGMMGLAFDFRVMASDNGFLDKVIQSPGLSGIFWANSESFGLNLEFSNADGVGLKPQIHWKKTTVNVRNVSSFIKIQLFLRPSGSYSISIYYSENAMIPHFHVARVAACGRGIMRNSPGRGIPQFWADVF